MTANEARDYLALAVQTATGRNALQRLGYGAIIDAPRRGDDDSSITAAKRLAVCISAQFTPRAAHAAAARR